MPDPVALIDLGSNAVRFVLAEVTPGVGYRILRKGRAQTRLGSGVNGHLSPRAVRETLQAIRDFLQTLHQDRDLKVLAVATAAVREAGARDPLLGPLRRDAGIEVSILSGQQEARLGALAALHSLDGVNGLVVDLGGGSLQVAEVRARSVTSAGSFPLGAVRMTERFMHHDPPLSGEVEKLRREIRRQLVGVPPSRAGTGGMVGVGGTVRTLARIHLGLEDGQGDSRQGLRLTRAVVTAIRENLQGLPRRQRQRVAGLKPERADIIVAGAIVLEELMILTDCPALTVCKTGVRDGILLQQAFGSNATGTSPGALRPRSALVRNLRERPVRRTALIRPFTPGFCLSSAAPRSLPCLRIHSTVTNRSSTCRILPCLLPRKQRTVVLGPALPAQRCSS